MSKKIHYIIDEAYSCTVCGIFGRFRDITITCHASDVTCKLCRSTKRFKLDSVEQSFWPRIDRIGDFLFYGAGTRGDKKFLNIRSNLLTSEQMQVFVDLVLEKLGHYLPEPKKEADG
jgi:hypothetical protein